MFSRVDSSGLGSFYTRSSLYDIIRFGAANSDFPLDSDEQVVILIIHVLIASLLVLAGCGGTPTGADRELASHPGTISSQRQVVVRSALDIVGTPYLYGGASPNTGFDCSGLVHYTYLQAGRQVPRTVSQQKRYFKPVKLSRVRPGDLLFFDTRADGGHIGIYLGEGRFIHAPSTGGSVRIDRLNDAYWKERVLGAGGIPGA